MTLFATAVSALACFGLVQALGGLAAVRTFRARARAPFRPPSSLPPVTILKPLHGDEPMLEEALASFCAQDYPVCQIVFGIQNAADPARQVVERLRARFPGRDITLVIDATPHGANRKVANLINMYPSAKHDVLVIADSDTHAAPDYLLRIVMALEQPGTGLVTTLYSGIASEGKLANRLGAGQISHIFLPGALLARILGRQDCLGATMALRRDTLEAVGGLHALSHHIADDAVLGRLVVRHGLRIGLATTVPSTTVPETSLSALFQHELRWGRTVQSVAPIGFVLSSLQFPIFWALLALPLSEFAPWSLGVLAASWTVRALTAHGIDRALGLSRATPFWLLPLREMLSVAVILATYRGGDVQWRGQVMKVERPYEPSAAPIRGNRLQRALARQRLLGEG